MNGAAALRLRRSSCENFFDDFVHIDDEVSLRTSVDIRVKFTRSRQGRPSDPQSCGNMA